MPRLGGGEANAKAAGWSAQPLTNLEQQQRRKPCDTSTLALQEQASPGHSSPIDPPDVVKSHFPQGAGAGEREGEKKNVVPFTTVLSEQDLYQSRKS